MAYDVNNPIIRLWEAPYSVTYAQNRLLSAAYTYAQARVKYPYWIGWCEWAGYNQSQVLAMDEFSTAVNDAFWRTNTVMSNLSWSGPLPAATYAAGPLGKGTVILPSGRWNTTMPLLPHPSSVLTAESKRPYYANGITYSTLGTAIVTNKAGWVGPPANPSAGFAAYAADYARVDGIRSANWGGYGSGYCEGLEISNILISGNRRPQGSWNDPTYIGTGIAVWDAGETSIVSNNYTEDVNTYGIEFVYGTPGTCVNNSTFRSGITGHMITGGGSGHSVHRIFGPSGDDNGNSLIGIRAGYGFQAGGNIFIYGAKHEALGADSYTALTNQGIPAKGQILFNSEASTHILNLNIFGAGTKNLNVAVDSMIRIATPAAGTRSTVNVQGLYMYGGNAVKNILQVGGNRYPMPATYGYMGHTFTFTSGVGVTTGTFISQNGYTITPTTSSCTGKLGWLPWVESTQTRIGDWNYSTCTPSWNPQTGIGGSIPPPPPAVLTLVSVAINPTSVTGATTAQATAVAYDQYGNVLPLSGAWSLVSGPGTVNSSGLITSNGTAGTVRVRYTQGAVSGEADLTVLADVPVTPVATTINVSVSPTSANVGTPATATAVVLDQNNNVMVNAGAWSLVSGNGSINSSGVITSLGAGPIVVRYQQGSASGVATFTATAPSQVVTTVNVTVSPSTVIESQTAVANAVVLDQSGNAMPLAGTWSIVSGPATISGSGLVTTTGSGSVVVRYTQASVSGNATLTVDPNPGPPPPPAQVPATVVVTVSPQSVVEGSGAQAIAQVFDQNGVLMNNVPGSFSIQSGSATISASSGAIATTAASSVTVRFTVQQNGIYDESVLDVTAVVPPPPNPPSPSTITISVSPVSVQAGSTAQATAVVRDQYGNLFPSAVNWGVVSGPGAINSAGLITTSGVGSVVIRGTVAGYSAVTTTTSLIVTSIPAPPGPTPLYSITFAGKDVMALPGCTAVPATENYRAGQITGSIYSTKRGSSDHRNTRQVFSTPITGVRRIVLKNAVVKEGQSGRSLNSAAMTNRLKQFVRANTSSPIVGSFTVNAGATDITIDFGIQMTVTTLFGADPSVTFPNTLWIEMTGLEMWSTGA